MKTMKTNNNRIWASCIIVVFIIIAITLIFISLNPYTIRFEMDANTLEAIKSINWSEIPK